MKSYFEIKDSSNKLCCLWNEASKTNSNNPYHVKAVEIFKKPETEEFESPYKIALYLKNSEDFSLLRRKVLIAVRMGMEADGNNHGYGIDESEAKDCKLILEGDIEKSLNMLSKYKLIPESSVLQIKKQDSVLKLITLQQKDQAPTSTAYSKSFQ